MKQHFYGRILTGALAACVLLNTSTLLPLNTGAFTSRQALAVTSAEKQAETDEMIQNLNTLQTELNQINADYDAAVIAHEAAEAQVLEAQTRENNARTRISELQQQLGTRAQQMYRQGNSSFIDVIFGAQTFIDFLTAIEVINRVNAQDAALTAETKLVRAEAEAARIECTRLEQLASEHEKQMAALLTQKQNNAIEMQAQIAKLQQEVEELRHEEELRAEEARRRAEEDARARAAAGNYGGGNRGTVTDEQLRRVPSLTHPMPTYSSISSYFGWRDFDSSYHLGLDLAAPTGTPIYAAAAGTVIKAGWENISGNVVYIVHGNGVVTVYGHASAVTVSAGQYVQAGDQVALCGSTGYATGPHLHFQLEIDGIAVDPLIFL